MFLITKVENSRHAAWLMRWLQTGKGAEESITRSRLLKYLDSHESSFHCRVYAVHCTGNFSQFFLSLRYSALAAKNLNVINERYSAKTKFSIPDLILFRLRGFSEFRLNYLAVNFWKFLKNRNVKAPCTVIIFIWFLSVQQSSLETKINPE